MTVAQIKQGVRPERLKYLREEQQLSQREFARRCGFSETLIRKYELGETEPTSFFLKVMAEQLNVSADYLLGISDNLRGHLGDAALNDDERVVIDVLRREGWLGVARISVEKLSGR